MDQNDKNTSIEVLRSALAKFRDDRDWAQFHTPKDLAVAISIEASELQEKFLWKTDKQIEEFLLNPEKREGVIEELMDVFNYALCLANVMDIDVASSSLRKLEKNANKYPVDKAKGKATKYNEL